MTKNMLASYTLFSPYLPEGTMTLKKKKKTLLDEKQGEGERNLGRKSSHILIQPDFGQMSC